MVPVDHASRRESQACRIAPRVVARCVGAAFLTALAFSGPAFAEQRAPAAPGDQRCRLGAARQPFLPVLPAARDALRATGQLTIVALGSSTTAGGGREAGESYPAVLQSELSRRLPNAVVTVMNKGVGGQSAYDMLMRMQEDVIDLKPSVVIWQAAVNDVIRDIGEQKLAKILRKGIRQVQAAGIDMVLMDLPWLPRHERYPQYDDYRSTLGKTARELKVSVFPRYALMQNWATSKQFTSGELVGMDGLHLVDAGYRCLAIRIADGIAGSLTGSKPDMVESPRATN